MEANLTTLFVMGAGTDVGKTFVTVGLICALRRHGRAVMAIKPVASGLDMENWEGSDTGILLAALGLELSAANADAISPWRFQAPLSLDMAARREGRRIDFGALVGLCRTAAEACDDALLIEAAGGVMSPLDETHTMLDWAVALGAPALLVVGSYLGAISHALTALDALKRRDVRVRAVVVSETLGSPVVLNDTVATVQRFARSVPVVGLPRLSAPDEEHPALDNLAGLL